MKIFFVFFFMCCKKKFKRLEQYCFLFRFIDKIGDNNNKRYIVNVERFGKEREKEIG